MFLQLQFVIIVWDGDDWYMCKLGLDYVSMFDSLVLEYMVQLSPHFTFISVFCLVLCFEFILLMLIYK